MQGRVRWGEAPAGPPASPQYRKPGTSAGAALERCRYRDRDARSAPACCAPAGTAACAGSLRGAAGGQRRIQLGSGSGSALPAVPVCGLPGPRALPAASRTTGTSLRDSPQPQPAATTGAPSPASHPALTPRCIRVCEKDVPGVPRCRSPDTGMLHALGFPSASPPPGTDGWPSCPCALLGTLDREGDTAVLPVCRPGKEGRVPAASPCGTASLPLPVCGEARLQTLLAATGLESHRSWLESQTSVPRGVGEHGSR